MTHLKCLDGPHYMGRARNTELCYVSPALGPRGGPVCLEGYGWKSHVAGETQGPPEPGLRCGCIRSGDPEVLQVEGQPSFLSPGGRLRDSCGRTVPPDSEGPLQGESSSQARRAQSPTERLGTASLCPKKAGHFQVSRGALRSKPTAGGSNVQGSILLRKSLDVLSALPGTAPPRPTASTLDAENGNSAPPRDPGQCS